MRFDKLKDINISVIGAITMDLICSTPRFPSVGETILGTEFYKFPGGKGANQAATIGKLGGTVSMIGYLGEDYFADEILLDLQNLNVNTDSIKKISGHSTAIGNITVDENGDNKIVVIPGVSSYLKKDKLEEHKDKIKNSNMLILQLETDFEMNMAAINFAHENKIPVLLNPAPARAIKDEYLEKLDFITPNETEAEILTGIKINSIEDAKQAAKVLLNKKVKNIIITLGDKGALFTNNEKEIYIEGINVEAIDTVAAGDSFNGAFALAYLCENTIEESIKFANHVAAIAVTRKGAMSSLPTMNEVEEFMKLEVEKV